MEQVHEEETYTLTLDQCSGPNMWKYLVELELEGARQRIISTMKDEQILKTFINPTDLSNNIKKREPVKESYILSNFCNRCKEEKEKLNACSRCKMRFYCSKECQKEDWILAHKSICDYIVDKEANNKIVELYITQQIIDIIYRLFFSIPRVSSKDDSISFISIFIINEPQKAKRYGVILKLCSYSREEYTQILKLTKQEKQPEETCLIQIRRLFRKETIDPTLNSVYYYIDEQTMYLFPNDDEKSSYKDKYIIGTEGRKITTLEHAFVHSFVIDGNVSILPKILSAMSMPSFVRYNPLPVSDEYVTIEESLLEKMKKRRDNKKRTNK